MVAIKERITELSSQNPNKYFGSELVRSALAEVYNLPLEDVTPENLKKLCDEEFALSVAESGVDPVTEEELQKAAEELRVSLGL